MPAIPGSDPYTYGYNIMSMAGLMPAPEVRQRLNIVSTVPPDVQLMRVGGVLLPESKARAILPQQETQAQTTPLPTMKTASQAMEINTTNQSAKAVSKQNPIASLLNWKAISQLIRDKRATPAGIRMFLDLMLKTLDLAARVGQVSALRNYRDYGALSQGFKPIITLYNNYLQAYRQAIDPKEKAQLLEHINQLQPYIVSYLKMFPVSSTNSNAIPTPLTKLSPDNLSGNSALFFQFINSLNKNQAALP